MSTNNIDPREKELLDLLEQEGGEMREDFMKSMEVLRTADREAATLSGSFNAELRREWEAELAAATPQAANRPLRYRSQMWWRIGLPFAAAAMLAVVLLWPGIDRTSRAVAWGDVVQAMQRVSYFHVIAFNDDPRRSDEHRRTARLDFYYQQPNHWRAQGMGFVGFLNDGQKKVWDVEKRSWTSAGDHAPQMFPPDFVAQHEQLGTLGAVLASIFDGKVPAGEPVKSDAVSAAQGIDVFDYASDATEKWVRIWVLRESKLPMKMHLYYPGSDAFMLVTFDYSDPQPDAFFNSEDFATQALRVTEPFRAYDIGSKPVAGTRPRGADQIHASVGGYRAPVVKRVVQDDAGDVMIVTDSPKNLTPSGSNPSEQGYRRVTDNWGNELIGFGGVWGVGEHAEHRWYFMPVPRVKTGTEPRIITGTFEVEAEFGKPQALKSETLTVGQSVPASDPVWGPDFEKQKQAAWQGYLRANGSLEQQLVEIDKRLAEDPKDIGALCWKFKVMREHDRDEAAWKLFESDLRDRIFGDDEQLNSHFAEAAQYMLHLDATGRSDELAKLAASVREKIAAAESAMDPAKQYSMLRYKEHNPLRSAAHLTEWREAAKRGPKVLRTIAGHDGMVFVELEIPKPPEGWDSNGWDGEAPYGWFWQPTPVEQGWQMRARLVKLQEGRLWEAFRGSGPLTLKTEAILVGDNYGYVTHPQPAKVTWQHSIDLPVATVDSMKEWWTKETGTADTWWPEPTPAATKPAVDGPQEWMNQAAKLAEAGQYEQALELDRKALAAPKEQWPAWYAQAIGLDPDMIEETRRQIRISMCKCLSANGRYDDARKVAAEIWAMLPKKPDLTDPQQGFIARDALLADLTIPKAMQMTDLMGAWQELTRIAKHRPNLAALPEHMTMVQRGTSRFGWDPKTVQQQAWRAYDTVWWRVRDNMW